MDLITPGTLTHPFALSKQDLKFGTVFTDHMFSVEYDAGCGWGVPAVKPLGLLQLHPASQVLHYGECKPGWLSRELCRREVVGDCWAAGPSNATCLAINGGNSCCIPAPGPYLLRHRRPELSSHSYPCLQA